MMLGPNTSFAERSAFTNFRPDENAVSPVDVAIKELRDPAFGWTSKVVVYNPGSVSPRAKDVIKLRSIAALLYKRRLALRTNDVQTQVPPSAPKVGSFSSAFPDQGSLPLSEEFAPSTQLYQMWLSSILESLVDQGKVDEVDVLRATSSQHALRHMLASRIAGVISTFAQQERFAANQSNEVCINGRFRPLMQTAICDRLLITPDRCEAFLSTLYLDLCQSLRRGARISGIWGELRVGNDGLYYDLNKPIMFEDRGFVRASEVE